MSKTDSKRKIIEKIIGNPSNTVSIMKKEDTDDMFSKTPIQEREKDINKKYEYIENEEVENDDYVYINEDDLSKEIELHRDMNLEYILSICIYKINHELRTPFLEFYFEKENGFYEFPETKITFNNIPENMDIDDYFLDECSRLYNSRNDKPIENISEMYKGFVDIGNNNIIAIFENKAFYESPSEKPGNVLEKPQVSVEEPTSEKPGNVLEKPPVSVEEPTSEKPENVLENPPVSVEGAPSKDSIWGILDEITIKNRILDIPVKQYIIDMFNEYQVLNNIKDSTDFPIERPIMLYQCNGTYKNYENNYYNDNEDRGKSISIIDERIEHDVFGNIYLFSTEPLEYNNLSKIKRYAAFINNTLYMLNKTNITKEELIGDETDVSKLPFKTYHCISFKEDDKDYWSINTNHLFIEL
jgi:hypothetical protein